MNKGKKKNRGALEAVPAAAPDESGRDAGTSPEVGHRYRLVRCPTVRRRGRPIRMVLLGSEPSYKLPRV
jgi:hypothetical protein